MRLCEAPIDVLRHTVKDYQRALRDFDRCLELAPDDSEAHRRRGRVRFKALDFAGAAADSAAPLMSHLFEPRTLRNRQRDSQPQFFFCWDGMTFSTVGVAVSLIRPMSECSEKG